MDAGFLNHKVILILTPQSWGKMLLAKHHYAIELAKRGNQVYFLNPPDNRHWNWRKKENRIRIESLEEHPNLFIIDQELYFPYKLKFHSRILYNMLIKKQIRDILQRIAKPLDLVWSFDLGNLFPLGFFSKKSIKVFHPVDEPRDANAIQAGTGADILFSVTREIIDKYKELGIPAYFINHGLADEFVGQETGAIAQHEPIHIGLSGNFLRPDMDRNILLRIIRENKKALFHFYGIYKTAHSNIGGAQDQAAVEFIQSLQGLENVELHGVFNTKNLARALNQMDALLICYDIERDQSKGTNYHKVMEYLSTGKVIISSNITTYAAYPDLIRMSESRENNESLPLLFKETIANLGEWNAAVLTRLRKSFAIDNTYTNQLNRVEKIISDFMVHKQRT